MLTKITSTLFHWKEVVVVSITDQAVLSLSNFLGGIFLARYLGVDSFGVYCVVFAAVSLTRAPINPILVDPVSSLGANYRKQDLFRYQTIVSLLTLGASLVMALVVMFIGIGLVYWKKDLGISVLMAGIVLPPITLQILGRRLNYLGQAFGNSLLASTTYGLTILFLLTVIKSCGISHPAIGFVLFGGASAAATLVHYKAVILVSPGRGSIRTRRIYGIILRHWRYGKWLLGSSFLFWVNQWAIYPVVAGILGPAASGGLRTVQTLLMPVTQVNACLDNVFLPVVARKLRNSRAISPMNLFCLLATLFGGSAALYGGLVSIDPAFLMVYIFGPDYAAYAFIVPVMAISVFFDSVKQSASIILQALRLTHPILVARVVGMLVTICGVIYLTIKFGLLGAAIGQVIVNFSILISLLIYLRIKRNEFGY